jgi:hypothetical protein
MHSLFGARSVAGPPLQFDASQIQAMPTIAHGGTAEDVLARTRRMIDADLPVDPIAAERVLRANDAAGMQLLSIARTRA